MGYLYKVQVGAYKFKANASRMKAAVETAVKKRKKAGKLKEDISVAVLKEGNLWKVQCGAFASEANAKKRLQEIHDAGFPKAKVMKVEVSASGTPETPDVTGPEAVLACMKKYLDSASAHGEIVAAFNKLMKELGHSAINKDSAWCTDFIVLCFYQAGLLDLIGYAKTSAELVKTAKEKGTWMEGTSDIRFGDVLIFCDSSRKPNHSEFALDGQTDISGNYNGGVHKRAWKGRSVLGRIRPDYESAVHPKVRFWGIRFWESDNSKYGDAECFIQYGPDGKRIDHVVLIDTGMSGTDTVKKLQAAGVKTIDAVVISHDHSDHYGYLSTIIQKFTVKRVYLPDQTGVDRYMKAYGNRIRAQETKCRAGKVPVTYLKKGDHFTVGKIRCDVIFQADASKLKEKDGHHFINNMSLVCRFTVDDTWTFHLAGDCQSEANNQLLAALKNLKCDVFKIQWHGDRGAISAALAKALKPLAALSNYHKKESWSSGRKATYDILRNVGCLVMRNYEDGEVYMDMKGKTMTVAGSRSGVKKVFKK